MAILTKDPLCVCGAVMEREEDITGFTCDVDEAWHQEMCKCPVCGKKATFWVVYSTPKFEKLEDIVEDDE